MKLYKNGELNINIGKTKCLIFFTLFCRSTTPLPPHNVEVTHPIKEISQKPKEGSTSTETSTETTVTMPVREVKRLSKFRQTTEDDVINIKKPIKHRIVSSFKKAEKLTTTNILDTTIVPTTSFRERGNFE